MVHDYVDAGHLFTVWLHSLVSRNGKCECI